MEGQKAASIAEIVDEQLVFRSGMCRAIDVQGSEL